MHSHKSSAAKAGGFSLSLSLALIAVVTACGDAPLPVADEVTSDAALHGHRRRCGNGICGGSETCASCPADCGPCVVDAGSSSSPADAGTPADVSPDASSFDGPALYVAPSGSATSACTQSSPCTMARADALATAGTTVRVAAGTYSGNFTLRAAGTSDARIRWVSDARWGAKIVGGMTVEGDYTDIDGFDVTQGPSSSNALVMLTGNFSRALRNHVHDLALVCGDSNGGAGIVFDGGATNYTSHDQEAIGNLVENIGSGPRDGSCRTIHGIYAAVPGGKIIDNVIISAVGDGVTSWHAATDLTVVNNTSVGNGGTGILIGSGDSGAVTSNQNSYVINNIVYGNAIDGITESSGGGHIPANNHFYNNLSYANGTDCISCTTWSQDEVGTIRADPMFVDAAGGDYHVQSSSPAVNHGTSQLAPANDFDGTSRPQGGAFDIGAYER